METVTFGYFSYTQVTLNFVLIGKKNKWRGKVVISIMLPEEISYPFKLTLANTGK